MQDGLAVATAAEATGLERGLNRYLRFLTIERGLSANTISAYRRDLSGYLDHLSASGIREPGAVTDLDISEFIQEVRGGPEPLAASSTSRLVSSIRGFHRFLVEEGETTLDPTADLRPPKLPARLPKAITVAQMSKVLSTTDGDDWQSIRDKALLEFMYATGARVSEAVDLNVDDVIDADGSGVTDLVRLFGKGGKQRIVPLGSFARSAIDSYLVRVRPELAKKGKAGPALFLGARGARLSRQNIWLVIQSRVEQAKLGITASPHTFRHSFATHLLEGGADVRVVQELLGHSSVSTTQIYTQVTADTLRDMYLTAHPRSR